MIVGHNVRPHTRLVVDQLTVVRPFQIGELGVVREVEDRQRATHHVVLAVCERENLDRDSRALRGFQQPGQLCPHHRRPADRSTDDRFVEDHPEPRRSRPGQKRLALHARREPVLQLGFAAGQADAQHGMGVVRRLEKSGHRMRQVLLHRQGPRLDLHEPAVLVRVGLPPSQRLEPGEVAVGAERRVQLGRQVRRDHAVGGLDVAQQLAADAARKGGKTSVVLLIKRGNQPEGFVAVSIGGK